MVLKLHQQITDNEIKISGVSSKKTPKNINFYYNISTESKNTLAVSIGINNNIPGKTLDFWCNDAKYFEVLVDKLETIPHIEINQSNKTQTGIIARWNLELFDPEQLLTFFKNLQ